MLKKAMENVLRRNSDGGFVKKNHWGYQDLLLEKQISLWLTFL